MGSWEDVPGTCCDKDARSDKKVVVYSSPGKNSDVLKQQGSGKGGRNMTTSPSDAKLLLMFRTNISLESFHSPMNLYEGKSQVYICITQMSDPCNLNPSEVCLPPWMEGPCLVEIILDVRKVSVFALLEFPCVSAFQSLRKCKGYIHNLQLSVSSSSKSYLNSAPWGGRLTSFTLVFRCVHGLNLNGQVGSSPFLFPHLIGSRGSWVMTPGNQWDVG